MNPKQEVEHAVQKGVEVVGNIFTVIFFLCAAGGAWFFIKKVLTKAAIERGKPQGLTIIPAFDDGPMKVDISFQQVPARNQKHRIHGGEHWWRMHMNIRMSNKDWELFKKSGLIENELFSYPNVEFPEIEESFPGIGLQWMPAYRDFPNISDAEAAKEKLVHALHIIRARVDDMKSTKGGVPDRERFEI